MLQSQIDRYKDIYDRKDPDQETETLAPHEMIDQAMLNQKIDKIKEELIEEHQSQLQKKEKECESQKTRIQQLLNQLELQEEVMYR